PTAGVTADAFGTLYGTTTRGGNTSVNGYGGGGGFKLTQPAPRPPGWTEQGLRAFSGLRDGIFPGNGNLVCAVGSLYGTTNGKASNILCGQSRNLSCDTIFKLTYPAAGKANWPYSLVHRFSNPAQGFNPAGGLIMDRTGALYGAAKAGGNTGCL